MNAKPEKSGSTLAADPDEAPEWTNAQLARAELSEGTKVIRPAGGTLTRGRGRPRIEKPKRQVSLRLDPDIIEAFKNSGPGWQSRVNEALREWLEKSAA